MTEKDLKEFIRNIPPNDGWWSNGNCNIFFGEAERMLEAGLQPDVISEILENLFSAVASEYGE